MSLQALASRKRPSLFRLLSAVALVGALTACASAGGEPQDGYRFEVLNQPVPARTHSTIAVRLVNEADGQPVAGATVTDAALTMRMLRFPRLAKGTWYPNRVREREIRFVGSPGGGIYEFLGDLSMPGTWTLSLTMRVPGQASPVKGSTRFIAGQERNDP